MGLWMLSCIHHIFQIQVAILLLQLRIRPPGKQMPSPYPADNRILINRCRTFIFTTAIAPINVLWTRFVFERVRGMSERRGRLAEISARLRKSLSGFPTLGDAQILPVVLGSNVAAAGAARAMRESGIWCPPVRYPTVPKNSARLRLSLNATLSDSDVAAVEGAFSKLREAEK